LSHAAMSLYLFLVAVSDAEGLSHWSEGSTCRLLGMEPEALRKAGTELELADLAAHEPPIWQVLDLGRAS